MARVLDEYTELGVPGVRVVLVDESGHPLTALLSRPPSRFSG
jgi:hypothetical protein